MTAVRSIRYVKFQGSLPPAVTSDPRAAMRWVVEHTPADQVRATAMVADIDSDWVIALLRSYAQRPGLVALSEDDYEDYDRMKAYAVAPGHTLVPADVAMNRQDEIRKRMAIWRELRATLPGWESVPLQVSQPHPLDLCMFTFAPRAVAQDLPIMPLLRHLPDVIRGLRHLSVFEQAVADEMNELSDEFGEDLAWNVETPVGTLAVVRGQSLGMAGLFGRLVGSVVARGMRTMPLKGRMDLHLCYGDYRHRALRAPKDLRAAVALLNPMVAKLVRTRGGLPAVHIPAAYGEHPAPLDFAFYAPLRKLDSRWRVMAGVVSAAAAPEDVLHALGLFEAGLGDNVSAVGAACGLGRTEPDAAARVARTQATIAPLDTASHAHA